MCGEEKNVTNTSNASWVAGEEDARPGSSCGSHIAPRPVSISLARKELSLLSKAGPSTSPHVYVVGEGQPAVAKQSSFLVTPGAEVDVEYIANPVYADRSPEVATPDISVVEAPRPALTPFISGRRTAHPAGTDPAVLGRGQEVLEGRRQEVLEGRRQEVLEGRRQEVLEGRRQEVLEGRRQEVLEGRRQERVSQIIIWSHHIGLSCPDKMFTYY
jgi:hypothetical protein